MTKPSASPDHSSLILLHSADRFQAWVDNGFFLRSWQAKSAGYDTFNNIINPAGYSSPSSASR